MLQTSAVWTDFQQKDRLQTVFSDKKWRYCQRGPLFPGSAFHSPLDQTPPSGPHAANADISGLQTVPGGS